MNSASGLLPPNAPAELEYPRMVPFSSADEIIAILDPELYTLVPAAFLDHHAVVPVRVTDTTLTIATCNPALDVPELAAALNCSRLDMRLVTPTDLQRIRTALKLGIVGEGKGVPVESHERDLLAPERELDARTVALYDALLLEAIGRGASDLHLERYGERVRVRLRIDGDLHDIQRFNLTPSQMIGITNVVKIRAGLDIAEHRLPQGGRFASAAGDRVFYLRVQTQPSLYGEHVIVRLLPQQKKHLSIEDLGFSPDLAKSYARLLKSPSGLLLVVGPTGSGKSTTLYAGLQIVAADESRKVITVEDPIEYAIEGVQQSQARADLGFDFASAMRAFVREDPDVILVGEIRDAETALEALRASQTGHVVLSTLHSNDSVAAVQRLVDLGMHPNAIASELMGVFAQRLAKRICTECKRAVDPPPELVEEIFGDGPPAGFHFFEGAGCRRCDFRGTSGRVAIVEFLPVDARFRTAISRQLPLDDLRAIAISAGLVPMRGRALAHVDNGLISIHELPEILSPEQLRPPAGYQGSGNKGQH